MSSSSDTIIAQATPPGVAALAMLRLSGAGCRELLDRLLEKPASWRPNRAIHRHLVHRGKLLDDVVLTCFAGPHSFTGEDTVEISCHGNPLIVRNVLEACLELGARLAEPGEFTQRAFFHGKLDLTQAEAVIDLINASGDHALAGAQAMKEGRLGEAMLAMRAHLIDLLAHLEAYIDFPDEDIAPEQGAAFLARVRATRRECERLAATAPLGRVLREGVRAVLVGAPNVGKSSLLNLLLRESRAIVSPTPGTTRDTIEAECAIGGFTMRLIDTAGQRETRDEIEAEGVRRARAAMAKADLVLHVVEAQSDPADDADVGLELLAPHQHFLTVANKADLGRHPARGAQSDIVYLSTKTGEGADALESTIVSRLTRDQTGEGHSWLTVNARQEAALRTASTALSRAEQALADATPPEYISVDLREALQEIGAIVGLATNEDVLDRLFASFCIGK